MLVLDKSLVTPLYLQIYNQLKDKIISGELKEGSVLPSIRSLAKTQAVSRNTVESAYQQLYSEGYILGKVGSGYKVQKIMVKNNINAHAETFTLENLLPEQMCEQGVLNAVKYNFQYGQLDATNFPFRIWRKLLNQTLLSDDVNGLTAYGDKKGDIKLKIQIMKYLNESRGVICNPEQMIICSGSMSSLILICQLLLQDVAIAAVEDPCYDSAKEILINQGYHIVPICLEKDGIHIEQLECSNAKLVYTTPSHQFPTGNVMSINKRLRLLEWAENNNAFIVEDDYDSEFRYHSRPIPSIHSLDKNGRVIYINSFSKALSPSLRIGFLVLPKKLLDIYQSKFSKYNCTVSWLDQKVMCSFMQKGHWTRLLNKVSVLYKKSMIVSLVPLKIKWELL